jgi:hypothetical protein
MTEAQPVAGNRPERRKMRARAALIRAAQAFIAAGKLHVPVLEITQAAAVPSASKQPSQSPCYSPSTP